jgi:hypothetical protein
MRPPGFVRRFGLPLLLCWGLLCLLVLPFFLHPHPVHAAGPWYVAPTGDDANPCLSPESPCASINAALNKPGFVPGDTILVGAGTYRGGRTSIQLSV